jgi:glycolate oxidase FAD binding subunit
MEYALTRMSEQVMTARANFRSLEIVGGGTKQFYGNPFEVGDKAPVKLQMSTLSGVLHYEPSELVLTAWAGTPLRLIQDALEAHGQMLAFDPPAFGERATIGGAVATGISGPRSFGYGPLRHYVLGADLLDAQGRVLKFGGEVMKNVAGYDVSRLLAGSLGIFGAIVQVSVKVIPKPAMDVTQRFEFSEVQALAFCAGLRARTLPVKAAAWIGPNQLVLRFCGAESAVKAALTTLGGQTLSPLDAQIWWADFREQTHPFFNARPLWRMAVRASTPALGLGPTAFDLGGEVRWLATDLPSESVRETALQAGGHATLFRWQNPQQLPGDGVFQPLAPAVRAIVKRLKQDLDPKSIFNPGRLVAGV